MRIFIHKFWDVYIYTILCIFIFQWPCDVTPHCNFEFMFHKASCMWVNLPKGRMACTFIFLFRKNQNAPPLLGVINVICACQCVNIGFVGLTVFRIIYILEKCSRTFKWTRLKKWTVHNKLSRVAFLHVSPSGEEQTVVVETHQCEYLLSAIIQIVKELQVRIPKVLSDSYKLYLFIW